jgi:hypothetical protein
MILFHLNSFGFFPRFFVPFIRVRLLSEWNCGEHRTTEVHLSVDTTIGRHTPAATHRSSRSKRTDRFSSISQHYKKKKMKTTKSVILSFIAESVDDICVIPIANNKKTEKKLKHLFSL